MKIVRRIFKILLGIYLGYVFVCLCVFPFAAKWGIESQGTKLLKTPVAVRWVQFNPFLWRLTLKGFGITDAAKQTMVGFDRLSVDVSFLALFKKQYRIESLELDGLVVHAALLPGNRVNLMGLVPAQPAQAAPPVQAASPAPASKPLPLVIVDAIKVKNGTVRFTDQTVQPNFSTTLSAINVDVTGLSTKPDCQAMVVCRASLNDKGVISTDVMIKPFVQPPALEATFTLSNYILTVVSPYTGKYTGRAVGSGALDLKMDYRIGNNRLTASHKLMVQKFEFGQRVESKDALHLPFGLAVALLEDPDGRIKISLPVTGDMSKPDFHYWGLVKQVARNFVFGLVTKPFAFLASAMGMESGTEELGYVRFEPGKAVLTDAEKQKLTVLVKGLQQRPKLSLAVDGSYDPAMDWKAIKADVLSRDYHVLRQQSLRSESAVYQMLYQRRFGIRKLWEFTQKFKLKTGGYDDAKLIDEAKRQLVEEGAPDTVALKALAQTRAQAVYDFILAAGFDTKRLRMGDLKETQGSMGSVPLEFTLTVFEEPSP